MSQVRRSIAGALFFLAIILMASCTPVEVRVVDTPAGSPAPAAGEQAAEAEGPTVDPLTERILTITVAYLTVFAEICGALVIAVAVVQALMQYLRFILRHNPNEGAKDDIRLRLGRSLAVALEFELAADILKTAVAPTWQVIAQLAAIIVLRILLNYFLERELKSVEQRRAGQHIEQRAGGV
jgi:uncharacterized membrane protein